MSSSPSGSPSSHHSNKNALPVRNTLPSSSSSSSLGSSRNRDPDHGRALTPTSAGEEAEASQNLHWSEEERRYIAEPDPLAGLHHHPHLHSQSHPSLRSKVNHDQRIGGHNGTPEPATQESFTSSTPTEVDGKDQELAIDEATTGADNVDNYDGDEPKDDLEKQEQHFESNHRNNTPTPRTQKRDIKDEESALAKKETLRIEEADDRRGDNYRPGNDNDDGNYDEEKLSAGSVTSIDDNNNDEWVPKQVELDMGVKARRGWRKREEEASSIDGKKKKKRGTGGIEAGMGKLDEKRKMEIGIEDDEIEEVLWLEFLPDTKKNPFNWTKSKKWVATCLGSWYTCLVAFNASAFAISIPSMSKAIGSSHEVSELLLSLYPLGFGIAPLVLAPFSEAYGRNVMYILTCLIWTLFIMAQALAQNIPTIAVSRFISGAAGSTGSTMVAGTLADIWRTDERGVPMSLFTVAAFLGTGFGPTVLGYVEQNLKWRWTLWIQVIVGGATFLAFLLFMRETRGSVLLSRIGARLRKQTGDERYRVRADEERASLTVLIKVSLLRPMYLLCTEPVVFVFSIWVAFAWGVMYLLLEAIPLVFENVYHFNTGQTGLAFASLAIGGILGMLTNPIQEWAYRRCVGTRGPEARLLSSTVGGIIFPIGCFIFAWTQGNGPWWPPLIACGVLMMGVYMIYTAVFNYLSDAYTLYASSANAAQSFLRNLAGFLFPLFTTQLYNAMGYEWASTLCGCLGLCGTMVPFILLWKGDTIRRKSRFAQELARMQGGQ